MARIGLNEDQAFCGYKTEALKYEFSLKATRSHFDSRPGLLKGLLNPPVIVL